MKYGTLNEIRSQCLIDANGCWLFQGRLTPLGYARVKQNGRYQMLHRLVLEMKLGRPLRDGFETCHADGCKTNCVNPSHLREGTHSENMQDRERVGRGIAGERNPLNQAEIRETLRQKKMGTANPNAKYSDVEIERVKELREEGKPLSFIARLLGMSKSHVSSVTRGKSRK